MIRSGLSRALLAFVGATTLLLAIAAAAQAQIPLSDARCRYTLGKGVWKLAKTFLAAQEKCHAQRDAGLLPPTLDCNDPLQSPSLAKIQHAVARLQGLAQLRCAGAPALLGYVTCPSPCPGLISDYGDVADCFACLTEQRLGSALGDAYGTPSPLPLGATANACQAKIGDGLSTYLLGRMREQERCQWADDRFDIGPDCLTADRKGKIARALATAQGDINQCSDATLAGLDSCAATLAGETSCIGSLADLHADALFVAIYRPSAPPPATPTATASRSATPTATLTITRTSSATATKTRTSTATATGTPTWTRTATPTYTATHTATRTATWTPVPTATSTSPPTATVTRTWTASLTPTVTATETPTETLIPTPTWTPLPPVHVDVTQFPNQDNAPCLIFVHGKRTNPGTFTDWNQARAYWVNGSDDFIRTATRNFTVPYYVVGYNGTQPYWHAEAAGELATEIVNATNGGADGGGNSCARTYADGGTFWLVGHSMAGSLIDYVFGNANPSDPNYNLNGPYDVATQRVSLAISVAGTHRGSQGADFVCGDGNPFCSFFAQFIQSCDDATYWLRSTDDVQVRTYASAPARNIWLTGGYAAIIGASACLAGEDDGVVQHASSYACNGSATTAYDNTNVCNNANKQESSGFKNLDSAHENHDQSRNDSVSDARVAIPDGIWVCNGAPCGPNTTVRSNLSTAAFVSTLY